MDFYTAATILLAILMIAMIIHVLNYTGFDKKQKKWFTLTFSSILFCASAEYALHCGYYDPKFKIILTILTVLQFAVAPTFAMFFAGALGLKNQGKVAIGFFSFCLTIGITCAPNGLIFFFDDLRRHPIR